MLKQDHMKAIRIEDRLLKALARIAKRQDRSVSWVIRDAIKQTPAAQWLRAKRVRSVKDLPERFDYPETDRIGGLYNLVRKELTDFFSNRMPVAQFRGQLGGQRRGPHAQLVLAWARQ